MYRAILGKPMGTLYGYKAIGLYQTEEQIANSPTALRERSVWVT